MAEIPGGRVLKFCFLAGSVLCRISDRNVITKGQHNENYSLPGRQFSVNPILVDHTQGQCSCSRMFASSLQWPFCFLRNKANILGQPFSLLMVLWAAANRSRKKPMPDILGWSVNCFLRMAADTFITE